jgi:hypothetical protein
MSSCIYMFHMWFLKFTSSWNENNMALIIENEPCLLEKNIVYIQDSLLTMKNSLGSSEL